MAKTNTGPALHPRFGRRPPIVAGRDALLDDTARALEVGPEHRASAVRCPVAGVTARRSSSTWSATWPPRRLGWGVLHVQALPEESLIALLLQRIPEALEPWERLGRGSRDLQAQLSIAVNLGVASAGATVPPRSHTGTPSAAAAFENLLGRVGSFAAGHGTGLLITIDQAQAAPPEDASAVARVLQTVVAHRVHPLAVIFGGLPTFQGHLGGAVTYARRLPVDEIGSLEPSAARLARVEPAARRGVAWEPEALDLLVRLSGGHPYYVQLFGWHAWEAAQGELRSPWRTPRRGWPRPGRNWWASTKRPGARLRPQERDYLAAVATLGGPGGAGVEEVAQALGKEPRQLAVARDRLVRRHGLLEVPERAKVLFVDGRWPPGPRGAPMAPRRPPLSTRGRRPRRARPALLRVEAMVWR